MTQPASTPPAPAGVTPFDPAWDQSYGDWVATELLGWCGCYSPELLADARTMLEAIDTGRGDPAQSGQVLHYAEALPGKPALYAELLMLTLDRADLVEHGTTIRYCWVTDWGRHVAATWAGDREPVEGT